MAVASYYCPVKVLLLGNSNDTGTFVPEDAKRQYLLRDQLAAEFGEPVEVFVRNAWPNQRMVGYVQRTLDELNPDFVYINLSSYAYTYESLPLRVRRIFGRVGGEAVGDAGMRLADSRKWSHNALFRGLRRAGRATIGGDTHFTPEEVLARYEELIRLLLRREGTAIAVKGSMSRTKRGTARERSRKEGRRQRVHQPLKQLCEQLHVYYAGSDEPLHLTQPWKRKGTKVGDGLHSNAAGHKRSAEWHYPFLREAWLDHLQAGETEAVKPVNSANG